MFGCCGMCNNISCQLMCMSCREPRAQWVLTSWLLHTTQCRWTKQSRRSLLSICLSLAELHTSCPHHKFPSLSFRKVSDWSYAITTVCFVKWMFVCFNNQYILCINKYSSCIMHVMPVAVLCFYAFMCLWRCEDFSDVCLLRDHWHR